MYIYIYIYGIYIYMFAHVGVFVCTVSKARNTASPSKGSLHGELVLPPGELAIKQYIYIYIYE